MAPLVIIGAYLVVTAPAALAGARAGDGAVLVAAAHLVALLVIGLALAARPAAFVEEQSWLRVFFDWLPLIAVPLLYAELPALIAGAGSTFHDATVQSWEAAIFGASPARTLAGAWPYRPLSELLHLGYLSYYALIYGPPLLLYVTGRKREFELTITAVAVCFAVCFAIFVAFPVAGPRYVWPPPAGAPEGPVRSLVVALLAAGSSRGAAFPSSHVAVAVTQTALALRFQPRIGAVCVLLTALLATGAVYGGFHYGVDVFAGMALGAAVSVAVFAASLKRARESAAGQLVSSVAPE